MIYLPDILRKQTRVHGTLGITEFRISDFQTFIFEIHVPEVPSKRRWENLKRENSEFYVFSNGQVTYSVYFFRKGFGTRLPIRVRQTAWPTKGNPYKTYLMLSMKWVLNNSYLSFGQSQGDTYWKGLFIECRSDMQVGGLSCDNYQYPWFIMDAIILSSRISYVLAWILLAVSK